MPQTKCSSCDEVQKAGEVFIRCVSCHMQAHASCLEMSDEMMACVATYPWQCIECKRCTVCSLGDQEESMIFCDKCDRGFHTHCIGLSEAPQGSWICLQYCNPQCNLTVTPRRPASRKRSVVAT